MWSREAPLWAGPEDGWVMEAPWWAAAARGTSVLDATMGGWRGVLGPWGGGGRGCWGLGEGWKTWKRLGE